MTSIEGALVTGGRRGPGRAYVASTPTSSAPCTWHRPTPRILARNGVHAGFIDTEMVTAIKKPKISPELVAEKVMQALKAGQDEVLVDQLTEQAKAALAGPVDRLAIDRLPG